MERSERNLIKHIEMKEKSSHIRNVKGIILKNFTLDIIMRFKLSCQTEQDFQKNFLKEDFKVL